jgi:Macrocin-O-methyltransferase (TylF)
MGANDAAGKEQRLAYLHAVGEAVSAQAADELAAEARRHLELVGRPDPTADLMRDICGSGLAMALASHLRNLRDLALSYADQPGAFVECGVARGGCLALMSHLAGPDRITWGFDSFDGLPELGSEDEGSGQEFVGFRCSGEGQQAVSKTFTTLGLPMSNVRIVAGWFDQTLRGFTNEVGPIALLRLDADWYEPTRLALEAFYDSVISGGAIIINDYFTFTGCQRAVDEFRAGLRPAGALQIVDPYSEVFWLK